MIHSVVDFLADHGLWIVIAVLFVNILQKKFHDRAQAKRIATLIIGAACLAVVLAAKVVSAFTLSPLWFFGVLAATAALLIRFRRIAFPFRLRCRQSGKRLDLLSFLTRDSNTRPEHDPHQ